MIKDILLKFYESQRRNIEIEDIVITDELLKSPFFHIKNNEIILNSYIYVGVISIKNNFAFLLQNNNDLYIERIHCGNALDRDIVLVKNNYGDYQVIDVLKRNTETIVATVKKRKKIIKFFSEVDYHKEIVVTNETDDLVNGHVVKLLITDVKKDAIICKVEKIIGHQNDPGIDILKIIYAYDWPIEFSSDILNELKEIKVDMKNELKTRRNLTSELIVTIDSEDAKDLDDAISLNYENGLYNLSVHIADVSYFVKEKMLTDNEALKRATSVYLVDRVIPMLPHYLSDNLCSLNEEEEKFAITVEMAIDSTGEVTDFDIFPSVIKSSKRLSYNIVNNFLENNASTGNKNIDDMLSHMNELSNILKQVRNKRGAINFKSDEIKFIIDDLGNIKDVALRETRDAEGLIESFMLITNETVAKYIYSLNYPGIYRIHEKPDAEKLKEAFDILKILGVKKNDKSVTPKTLQRIVSEYTGQKLEYIVSNTLLRAMKRAKYTNHLDVHYGLQARYYTHFTSPIRRYPDLMVHRLLRDFIFNPDNLDEKIKHFESILYDIADRSSVQERKAIDMEREVVKLKSAEYMQGKSDEIFKAIIVKLTKYGMFVRLDNGIEGFVSLRDLRGYYTYDEKSQLLYNDFGKIYRLNDTIKVQVLSVDIMEKQINFKIFEKGRKHENNRHKQKGKA